MEHGAALLVLRHELGPVLVAAVDADQVDDAGRLAALAAGRLQFLARHEAAVHQHRHTVQ